MPSRAVPSCRELPRPRARASRRGGQWHGHAHRLPPAIGHRDRLRPRPGRLAGRSQPPLRLPRGGRGRARRDLGGWLDTPLGTGRCGHGRCWRPGRPGPHRQARAGAGAHRGRPEWPSRGTGRSRWAARQRPGGVGRRPRSALARGHLQRHLHRRRLRRGRGRGRRARRAPARAARYAREPHPGAAAPGHRLAPGGRPRVARAAVGAGRWVPELVRRAGGWELLGREGEDAEATTWERLREVDPEVLVLALRGLRRSAAAVAWRRRPCRPGSTTWRPSAMASASRWTAAASCCARVLASSRPSPCSPSSSTRRASRSRTARRLDPAGSAAHGRASRTLMAGPR